MSGFFGAILDVLFPTRTREGPGSARAVAPLPIHTDDRYWDDRTREEKRVTAPYALGWEEGHEAAYREYLTRGRVTPVTKLETHAHNIVTYSEE